MSDTPAADRVTFVTIDEGRDGQRLDNFLITHLKGVPRSRIYRIIRSGEVRVNKKRAKQTTRLAVDDVVTITPDDPLFYPGAFFVGVYGIYDSTFEICATLTRQRVQVRHATALEGTGYAEVVERDGGLYDSLPWRWNPDAFAKRNAYGRFTGRGYPKDGYASPYHLLLDMCRREACADVESNGSSLEQSIIILTTVSILVIGLATLYLAFSGRALPHVANTSSAGRGRLWVRVTTLLSLVHARLITGGALLRILLGYCQCLSMTRRYLHVRWPRSFINFLMALDQLTLEVFDIVPAECALGRRVRASRALESRGRRRFAAGRARGLVQARRWAVHGACRWRELKHLADGEHGGPAGERPAQRAGLH